MTVGGVDIDEMRCALATYQQLRNSDQATIAGLLVKNQMLQSDLDAARGDLAAAHKHPAKNDDQKAQKP